MLAMLAVAAVAASTFSPPDCVTRHWQRPANGPLVVTIDHKRGLWEISPSGAVIRRLTAGFPGAGDSDPQFSADHRHIAYLHGTRELWVRGIGGGARRVLAPPAAGDELEDPRWSPDGRWIAFVRRTSDHATGHATLDVARVHPDGTGLESLGPVSEETSPEPLAWSPNGKCIVSQWGDLGDLRLAIGPVRTRTTVGAFIFGNRLYGEHDIETDVPLGAEFSPDGRVVYVEDTDYIWAVRLDRQARLRLAIPGKAGSPVPSPDGRMLAFKATHSRHTYAYVSRLRSRRAVRLPHVLGVVDWWAG
jgi:Tol biopolymer transport system component